MFPTIADDIYMTISSDRKYYYLNYNNQKFDVTTYLDQKGVKTTNDSVEQQSNETTETTNTIEENVIENNDTGTQNSDEDILEDNQENSQESE